MQPLAAMCASLALVASVIATAVGASALPANDATPEVVVAALYEAQARGDGPFFQTEDRARVERWFSPRLAQLIWDDAQAAQGEVGALEADPLHDAQDTEIAAFAVHAAEVDVDSAQVRVTFTNFGEPRELVYLLERNVGAWRIANIEYGEDHLLERLRNAVVEE